MPLNTKISAIIPSSSRGEYLRALAHSPTFARRTWRLLSVGFQLQKEHLRRISCAKSDHELRSLIDVKIIAGVRTLRFMNDRMAPEIGPG
jgi:hypothetical protein